MKRRFLMLWIGVALSGCISTPDTKALITPVGAAGYHTFAPKLPPAAIEASEVDDLAAAGESQRQ